MNNKSSYRKMVVLFTLLYLMSYVTRINYSAVISEISEAEQLKKSLLSLALTGSFITYGGGQLLSGFMGDRIQPKIPISCALLTTICTNLLIPICQSPYQMTAVWCVNGLAQAFMWPPLVRIMTELFNEHEYSRACELVSMGSSVGTIFVYVTAPIVIAVSGWRMVFVLCALLAVCMLIWWIKTCPKVENAPVQKVQADSTAQKIMPGGLIAVVAIVMISIILTGALREGVNTWMPSYISETYGLQNEISILSGAIMPLFSMMCFHIATQLYRKKFKNPMVCAGVMFLSGLIATTLLSLTASKNALLSVLCFALLIGSMHGVTLILTCMVPAHFKQFGNISFISGLLNSCAYVGAALSTYGIAVLCENSGWAFTIGVWCMIALLGVVLCFVVAKQYGKKIMNNQEK